MFTASAVHSHDLMSLAELGVKEPILSEGVEEAFFLKLKKKKIECIVLYGPLLF